MNLREPWKPGVSPNPGGVRKGTVFVSECYKRLLTLSPEQLEAFVPATVADEIALARIKKARTKGGLRDTAEITDRIEGKAPQRIEHANVSDHERLIIRLQERFLERTGIELSREDAIARLVEIDPGFAGQFEP